MTPEQAQYLLGCRVVVDHKDVPDEPLLRLLGVSNRKYTVCTDDPMVKYTTPLTTRVLLWRDRSVYPQGQIVDRSWSDGLSVFEAWCSLFDANAWLVHVNLGHYARSDEQIYKAMCVLFPARSADTKYWTRVSKMRHSYNRGALSVQAGVVPTIPCRQVGDKFKPSKG